MEWMFMPLKRYAEFSGRSRRTEFWMWILFQVLLGIVVMTILMMLVGGAAMSGDPAQMMAVGGVGVVIYALYILVSLAFLIPNLAVTIRRLHDTNRSGWWVLLYWVPYLVLMVSYVRIMMSMVAGADPQSTMNGGMVMMVAMLAWLVGCLVLLVFMFLEGTKGPNKYGPDPKGGVSEQVFT